MENNFHQAIEKDLEYLKGEIAKLKETEKDITKKELIKGSLRSIAESDFLPSYFKEEEISDEVKAAVVGLLDMVFHKGILAALRESKKYSPFIQDAFHDALADKILPELEKRGII